MDIKQELFTILEDFIDLPSEELDLDQPLKMAGGLNSFAFLSMVASIEEHFNIHFPTEKLQEFRTLNDIIRYIESAKGGC